MDGKRWIARASVCLASACAGEDLSVGGLRCEGDGVRCDEIEPYSSRGISWMECEAAIGEPATVVWRAELPCPDGHTCSPAGSQLVVHEDGSSTVLRRIEAAPDDSGAEIRQRGVSLRRFDADGELLWENDDLIATESSALTVPGVGGTAPGATAGAALATDAEDGVLLAVVLGQFAERTLEVHRIATEEQQLESLFRAPAPSALNAIASIDGDVLIASHHQPRPGDSNLPELARHRRDGTLVWRQTALDQLSRVASWSGLTDAMPLAIDSRGRATIALFDPFGVGLVSVGPDGNLDWLSLAGMDQPPGHDCPGAHLAIDSHDRVIVGYGKHQVARAAVDDPEAVWEVATRMRDEYWEPYVLGLDRDRNDRVLVATQTGTHGHPMMLIDRVSADFSGCETFNIADASELLGVAPPADESECLGVLGIRVAANGDVYFWSESTVGRIALP